MEAVKKGAGRETAHEAIKEHSIAAATALRNGGDADLVSRLAGDKRVNLGKRALQKILSETHRFIGGAPHQVDTFVTEARKIVKRQKGAVTYQPGRLL